MRRNIFIIALPLGVCLPLIAWATEQFSGTVKSFQGSYLVYGGGLGDWTAPTQTDAKLYLEIRGGAARDIFSHLSAKTQKAVCGNSTDKMRSVGETDCVRHANGDVICHVGIDLKSGKSISGSIC